MVSGSGIIPAFHGLRRSPGWGRSSGCSRAKSKDDSPDGWETAFRHFGMKHPTPTHKAGGLEARTRPSESPPSPAKGETGGFALLILVSSLTCLVNLEKQTHGADQPGPPLQDRARKCVWHAPGTRGVRGKFRPTQAFKDCTSAAYISGHPSDPDSCGGSDG